jgi:hypothetical protein
LSALQLLYYHLGSLLLKILEENPMEQGQVKLNETNSARGRDVVRDAVAARRPPQYAGMPRSPSNAGPCMVPWSLWQGTVDAVTVPWSLRPVPRVPSSRAGWRRRLTPLARWPPHVAAHTPPPRPYRDPTTTTRLGAQEVHTTASHPVIKGRCRPSSREHLSPRRGRHCCRHLAPCSAYCRDLLIASSLPSCTVRACTPV